jgi:hypothetical protein
MFPLGRSIWGYVGLWRSIPFFFFFLFSLVNKGTVRLVSVTSLNVLPVGISTTNVIGFKYDGSNVEREDFSGLRFENGAVIPDVGRFLAPKKCVIQ